MATLIQWLNSNAGAIQAIATVVLVGVTIVYVIRTTDIANQGRRQVEEMKEQRWNALRPIVLPDCKVGIGHEQLTVTCHNLGPGPGLDATQTLFPSSCGTLRREWGENKQPDDGQQGPNLHVVEVEGELLRGGSQSAVDRVIQVLSQLRPERYPLFGGRAVHPEWHVNIPQTSENWEFCIIVECKDVYDRIWRAGRDFLATKDGEGHWQVEQLDSFVATQPVERRLRSYV